MKIAITGASGFIGKYAVEHFKNIGFDTLAIGRNITKLNDSFDNSVMKIETDYNYYNLLQILKGTDAIIHLAGMRFQKDLDPLVIEPYIDTNILLTQNLLKASQVLGINRVVQSSSIGVYSNANKIPFNESHASFPITIYGISKLTCEHLANLFSTRTSVKVSNLRLASLYGIGEKEGVVFTDYVNLARKKEKILIWGKGETRLDLIYIKDVIEALEKSIAPNAPSGTYNIGSGKSYSVRTIAENINTAFANQGNLEFLKEKKEGGYNIYMDVSKAKNELGWESKWTMENALMDMKKIINE